MIIMVHHGTSWYIIVYHRENISLHVIGPASVPCHEELRLRASELECSQARPRLKSQKSNSSTALIKAVMEAQYGDSSHCVSVKSHPTGLDLSFRDSMDRMKESD